MRNIFIIGSKGVPARYGGFETFVDELVSRSNSNDIKYHVSCLDENNNVGDYQGARTFNVKVPNIGPTKAIYYDVKSLKESINYISENAIEDAIIYILACRIGPFMWMFKRVLKKHNITIFVNPDGHEWKRKKWNWLIRKYWKFSEKLMVKHSSLLVCDSKNIEKYILEEYNCYNPKTTFIAYGADVSKSTLDNNSESLVDYYRNHHISANNYYLIVSRFVPENNYELVIKEFVNSNSTKDLVIISNVEQNKFYNELKKNTNFESDSRVKFVGTLYNPDLLKKVRENAFAYIHGHEVGGTNPSLLEALASTELNLLLDVGFNKEVAESGALYFSKEIGSLSSLLNDIDNKDDFKEIGSIAKGCINDYYDWDLIVKDYESIFK